MIPFLLASCGLFDVWRPLSPKLNGSRASDRRCASVKASFSQLAGGGLKGTTAVASPGGTDGAGQVGDNGGQTATCEASCFP